MNLIPTSIAILFMITTTTACKKTPQDVQTTNASPTSAPTNLPNKTPAPPPTNAAISPDKTTTSKRQLARPAQPQMAIRNAPRPNVDAGKKSPEQLFNSYCQACHSLKLVEAQRLNRDMWEWVMEDITTEYGAAWITKDEQKILIDYLVEHYGPES